MQMPDTIEFAVRNLLLEWRHRHPEAEGAYMINDLVFALSVVIASYDPDGRVQLIKYVTDLLPSAVADRVSERTSEALATLVKPGLA
jgi:hypothetical protein